MSQTDVPKRDLSDNPECSLADENCGGAPQYADGKCYWHFMHTDRPSEGAPGVVVLDTPGEQVPAGSGTTALGSKKTASKKATAGKAKKK